MATTTQVTIYASILGGEPTEIGTITVPLELTASADHITVTPAIGTLREKLSNLDG